MGGVLLGCPFTELWALIVPDALTAMALIQADRPTAPRIEELMSKASECRARGTAQSLILCLLRRQLLLMVVGHLAAQMALSS